MDYSPQIGALPPYKIIPICPSNHKLKAHSLHHSQTHITQPTTYIILKHITQRTTYIILQHITQPTTYIILKHITQPLVYIILKHTSYSPQVTPF